MNSNKDNKIETDNKACFAHTNTNDGKSAVDQNIAKENEDQIHSGKEESSDGDSNSFEDGLKYQESKIHDVVADNDLEYQNQN